MRARFIIAGPLMALAGLGITGCLEPRTAEPEVGAVIRFVNATSAPLDVLFDGQLVLPALPATRFSARYVMDPGQRTIGFRNAAGATVTVPVTAAAFQTFTAIALPGQGASPLVAEVREDTNAVAVAERSKLRVMHLAPNAPPVDVWRTQPDAATPTRIMTPFGYGATSPYLLSDPGEWNVWVTPADGAVDDTLAQTGPIALGSLEVATVFLLDSAGVLVLRAAR